MLARDHARLAALAALGVCAVLHVEPVTALAASAVTAGAALAPDIDHPDSLVSRSLGVVSWLGRRVAAPLGHRGPTHTLLAAALAGGLTWALGALVRVQHHPLGPVVATFLGLDLALCALVPLSALGPLLGPLVAAGAAYAATWWLLAHVSLAWAPPAVAGGWALHLVGDGLTAGGVPLAWPLSRRRYALPLLDHTGSTREALLGAVMLAGLVAAAWSPVAALVAQVRAGA